MTVLSLILVAMSVQTADTIAPAVAVESPYTIKSGPLELGGTLVMPRGATGRVPVAVIIAGSGPTDRNGNSRQAWDAGNEGHVRHDENDVR